MEATARNAVLFFNHRPQRFRIEQTQGALEHWTEFVAGLQHVDGMDFHQRFQPLRQRRFSTAHRPQQIENLLALFQTLSCVYCSMISSISSLSCSSRLGSRELT